MLGSLFKIRLPDRGCSLGMLVIKRAAASAVKPSLDLYALFTHASKLLDVNGATISPWVVAVKVSSDFVFNLSHGHHRIGVVDVHCVSK